MKRLLVILSVLGLVISVNAFAAAASVPVTQLVTVPIQNGGFHIGAEALYLQASSGDLDYAIVDNNAASIMPNGYAAKVDPSYKWGFGIDAGFHFAGTGNDLSAHYERLHTTDTNAVSGAKIWSRFIHPSIVQSYIRANATVNYKYDAVDVLLGQLVDIGHRLHTHLAAGVRYADLNSNMDATYYSAASYDRAILNSSFKGIGPRVALNGTYDLYRGFGFDADVGTSLLIGSMKASNNQYRSSTAINYLMTKGSIRHIVPELDAKLGLSYGHLFSKGKLTIMAGWKVINYFNAQDYLIYEGSGSSPPIPLAAGYNNSMSSICYNGPYAGFVFKTA